MRWGLVFLVLTVLQGYLVAWAFSPSLLKVPYYNAIYVEEPNGRAGESGLQTNVAWHERNLQLMFGLWCLENGVVMWLTWRKFRGTERRLLVERGERPVGITAG
jgi:hypothetical protein